MNVFLWIVQVLLALIFLLHGILFLILPARVAEELKKGNFSSAFGRFIGVAELLAAFGLLLPGWTRILLWLTPLAAVGLLPIMVGALLSHLRRKEQSQVVFCFFLIILLAVVALVRGLILPL